MVFVRKDAKRDRAPRWRWIVDVFFFQVTAEPQRMPIDIQPAFDYTDSACLFAQNMYIFRDDVFAFRPNALFVFVKFVAGLATKCLVKEKFWSRKGGFYWKKTTGTHIPSRLRVQQGNCLG